MLAQIQGAGVVLGTEDAKADWNKTSDLGLGRSKPQQ
jgi:hypothetical protein